MKAADFAKLKKQFVKQLKTPKQSPQGVFCEFGEYDARAKAYPFEDNYIVQVDPEGDAWVFLGPHSNIARHLPQDAKVKAG